MPRVPTYQPGQVAPADVTGARFQAANSNAGEIIARAGQNFGQALGNYADAQDRLNELNDDTQARKLTAESGAEFSKVLTEFKGLSAGAAREGQADFDKRLAAIRDGALAKASTPRMRKFLEERLTGQFAAIQSDGVGHALREAKVERKTVLGSQVSSYAEQAAGADTPELRDQYVASGLTVVRDMMREEGFEPDDYPDVYKVEALKFTSGVHQSVTDRMMATPDPDIDEIGKYVEAHADEMTEGLRSDIAKRLQAPLQDRIDDSRADMVTAYLKPLNGAAPASGTVGPWQQVAVDVANATGLKPEEVAGVISYETAGTFSPTIMGGKGGNYMGLIQFGANERKQYGIDKNSTPKEWSTAITSFLKDRGFKRGMGVLDLYSTINAGTPGRYGASDGNGTVASHVQQILGAHVAKGKSWLGGAVGYDNAPRQWDKASVYNAIEELAGKEGWTPEATKRVKATWDSRISKDEGLLRDQQQAANEQARILALKSGDNFRTSMIPRAVWNNLSPVDQAEYGAAETRIREAKAKDEAQAAGQSALWRLQRMQRFEPDTFKKEDLRKYLGVIPMGELNQLDMKQIEMTRGKPTGPYVEAEFRGMINSEIEFQQKHNGIKLDDERASGVFDYMSAALALVKKGGKEPNRAMIAEAFQSAMKTTASGDPKYKAVPAGIPDDWRARFVQSWKGRTPPTEGEILAAWTMQVQGR